jgi:hypothetical protein
MAEKMTKADALELMRKAIKEAEGSGHSLQFGKPPRIKFDSDTGEQYLSSTTPAQLECSDAKMRAIWSVWEKLPQIVRALDEASHGR